MKVLLMLLMFTLTISITATKLPIENKNEEVDLIDRDNGDNGDNGDNEQLEINVAGYKMKLKGFFSAAGAISNAKKVPITGGMGVPTYEKITDHLIFESDSLAGLQLNAPVTEQAEVVLQIVASANPRDIDTNKYELNATWAYLNYKFNDQLSLKAGRILVPIYMLSQYVDVAYAYPWIKTPREVYGGVPFASSNGVIGSYLVNINEQWQLELEPFLVANHFNLNLSGVDIGLKLKNQAGIAFNISNDWLKVTALYTKGELTFNRGNPIVLNPLAPATTTLPGLKVPITYLSFGLQAEKNNILVMAEYTQRKNPGSYLPDVYGWYVLGGLQIDKIMPWLTFAETQSFNKDRLNLITPAALNSAMTAALVGDQRSVAAGLRYNFATNMAFKLSVTHITPLNGSNGLFSLAPGQKSINVYNAGVNLVF